MIGNNSVAYTVQGLQSLIDSHEAISFDIFDTLVMRKVYYNHDVFRLVANQFRAQAPGFFEARRRAERELSQERYPYMEEIYKRVAEELGLDITLAMLMMQYEIEVERKVIVPRADMLEIFRYCLAKNKRVYIVSDMYMHQQELEDIINRLGIVGYDKIFVSCEYDTSKPQSLFSCYKGEIAAESYLHIGDSYVCDIEPSQKVGINSFRLKTSAEIWEALGNTPAADLEERTAQAEYICQKYNSPFSE